MMSSTPDTAAMPMPTPTTAPATTTPGRLSATIEAPATSAPTASAPSPTPAVTPYPSRAAHRGLSSEKINVVTAVGTK